MSDHSAIATASKRILELAASYSPTQIAEILNLEGHLTARGRPWSALLVGKVLKESRCDSKNETESSRNRRSCPTPGDDPARAEKAVLQRQSDYPVAYRKLYARAMTGKSLRAAVRCFCVECCGFQPREVPLCTAPACAFYPYRSKRLSTGKKSRTIEDQTSANQPDGATAAVQEE